MIPITMRPKHTMTASTLADLTTLQEKLDALGYTLEGTLATRVDLSRVDMGGVAPCQP